MNAPSPFERNVIKQYDKQMSAAKNLSKQNFLSVNDKVNKNIAEDINNEQNKRHRLVKRIAREIFDNLLFADHNNEIVKSIFVSLENKYGESFIFSQLPGKNEIEIYRSQNNEHTGDDSSKSLSAEEKEEILNFLWAETLKTVERNIVESSREENMDIKSLFGQSNIMNQVNKLENIHEKNKTEAAKPTISSQGDTVKLSTFTALRAEAHKEAMLADDVRVDKVQAVKEKLLAGEYRVDSKEIARKMLNLESEIYNHTSE